MGTRVEWMFTKGDKWHILSILPRSLSLRLNSCGWCNYKHRHLFKSSGFEVKGITEQKTWEEKQFKFLMKHFHSSLFSLKAQDF